MKLKSLDPRVTRAGIPDTWPDGWQPPAEHDQHETYEVFHVEKRGEHPSHVGSLHAPNPEIALLFAKEQYGRRSRTVGLWVVRTSDIAVIGLEEDADIFATATEKDYREAKGYRVGAKLKKMKEMLKNQSAESHGETANQKQPSSASASND